MADNLKWYFETTKNMVAGANDPIHETFRAFPYYSIVRESLQNSIDAVLDPSQPVKVNFEVINIKQKDYPSLFKIRDHIAACLKLHQGDVQAVTLYKKMLNYLDNNSSINILKVADYNTTGMVFKKDDVNCPFISFVRAEGKSAKGSGSGGSFGFGKGAYYVLSEIRTLLISTMSENGEMYFEGKTRLASHYLEEQNYGKDGFFNLTETSPVSDPQEIPEIFRRKEQGTDVYILGLLEDNNSGEQMIKSVLNNFWYAVHQNILQVKIKTIDKQISLNKENLDKLIYEYFPDEKESGSVNDIFNWNPKAYYLAVRHAGEADHFKMYEPDSQKYKMLKGVVLYLYRKEGLMNRTAYLRKTAMVVQKITNNIISGYVAVFVCKSDEGNEILKQMENAAHNQWKVENVRNATPEGKKESEDFKREMNYFVTETLKSLSSVDDSTRLEVDGLAEYLYIPEDLIESAEAISGNVGNYQVGHSSEIPAEEETGSLITSTNGSVKFKVRVFKPAHVAAPDTGDQFDLTGEAIPGGGKNGSDGGDMSGYSGSDLKTGLPGEGQKMKSLVGIKYRIVSSFEDGKLYHNLIINSPKEVEESKLRLVAGSDNGDDVEIEVLSTDQGVANRNILSGIHLSQGLTKVKVEFNDNLKHALKLVAYEIE